MIDGSDLLPGFLLVRGWAANVPLELVRDAVAWRSESIRMFGRDVAVPRLTAWYGDGPYTYSGIRHDPAPMPAVVRQLRDRAERELPARFNSVLANLYRDGRDSVAWHSDDEPELGAAPTIASLSFGASRAFAVRPVLGHAGSTVVVLAHGDLLVMYGRSQVDYQHAVPKTRTSPGPRVNLTFRLVG